MSETKDLAVIVKESGLDQSKAQVLLTKFQDYFAIAADWETKAKAVKVTSPSQVAEMKMAREGRLFLAKKRQDVENTRKFLKEDALREGQTIDAIAKILKNQIIPIEDYLGEQENFVKIEAAKKAEAERLEAERVAELERIAQEQAQAAEQERIRQENIRLQQEAAEREKQMQAERAEAEKKLAEERAKAEAERKAIEDKARKELEAVEAELAKNRVELEAQAEEARRREAVLAVERNRQLEEETKRTAQERIEREAAITCPKCGHSFHKGE